ncbi:MAG: hypothetical protein SPE30_11070, partial [Candidatus Treponema excrementipullorum]|nr:hypothetical protein [Candidatus Treponema excrementipullorum]
SVQWGVDLDSGKTGFKNSASVTLKLNLLNEGSKSTTGDGVWGELVIKTNGDTFAKATNLSYLALPAMNVVVDKAQINFGPAYVGITAGDTEVGKLKMDAAVKSADSDNAVTLPSVGSKNYTQGITIGYKNDMFNVAADVRSYAESIGVWRLDYVPAGYPDKARIDLPGTLYGSEDNAKAAKKKVENYYKSIGTTVDVSITKIGNYYKNADQYSHKYAMALEGEFTGVENLSVKAGVSYDFGELQGDALSTLGYSTSAGYKLALNDTFYLRPQVGFTGFNNFTTKDEAKKSGYTVAGGLLFGWGEIGIDDNAGVYFLDDDAAKKVSPGVGVVVSAPIKENADIKIAPSFFSGDIVPGLTAAAYSEIIVPTAKDAKAKFDLSSGIKYAVPVAAGTITPQLGVKFANERLDDKGAKVNAKFNLKAGVEVGGFVSNTTFFTVYESGNLIADEAGIGTLNFGAKISF